MIIILRLGGLGVKTRFGTEWITYSARGVPKYNVEVSHPGLGKSRVISATDRSLLQTKCNALSQEWEHAWQKAERSQKKQADRESRREYLDDQKQDAEDQTEEAREDLRELDRLLLDGLNRDPRVDWEALKDDKTFPVAKPMAPKPPLPPTMPHNLGEPVAAWPKYKVKKSFFDFLIPGTAKKKRDAAMKLLEVDHKNWQEDCQKRANRYREAVATHEQQVKAGQARYEDELRRWEEEKTAFEKKVALQHAEIDAFRAAYLRGESSAIIAYFEQVISSSPYPTCLRGGEVQLQWLPETGILLVSDQLPAPADLPRLKEVKYVAATDDFAEKYLTDTQFAKLYDDVIYKLTLRTLFELFESDEISIIKSIIFNGSVTAIDKRTGREATACVLSVQVSRDKFMEINLANVDPQACFRLFKGVGSPKLHSLTPVAPILEFDRSDARFIESHSVSGKINAGYNLAAMEWDEFEHLIREIFEKEFSSTGGEVRVTQASRDGGVDAVAFDPDPIRGGKIVIQAKRYTNTVGVSAVRDLYGTLMNEGANKGILVTTSDYGPDAFEFAQGKPLTLMNGSNLLHLLQRHGVSAHINLRDAKLGLNQR